MADQGSCSSHAFTHTHTPLAAWHLEGRKRRGAFSTLQLLCFKCPCDATVMHCDTFSLLGPGPQQVKHRYTPAADTGWLRVVLFSPLYPHINMHVVEFVFFKGLFKFKVVVRYRTLTLIQYPGNLACRAELVSLVRDFSSIPSAQGG